LGESLKEGNATAKEQSKPEVNKRESATSRELRRGDYEEKRQAVMEKQEEVRRKNKGPAGVKLKKKIQFAKKGNLASAVKIEKGEPVQDGNGWVRNGGNSRSIRGMNMPWKDVHHGIRRMRRWICSGEDTINEGGGLGGASATIQN